MPQLELGMLPLRRDVHVGMNVVFFVAVRGNHGRRRPKTISLIGRVVGIENTNVIIEDIQVSGSRFNRPVERVFEVFKDTSLEMWF